MILCSGVVLVHMSRSIVGFCPCLGFARAWLAPPLCRLVRRVTQCFYQLMSSDICFAWICAAARLDPQQVATHLAKGYLLAVGRHTFCSLFTCWGPPMSTCMLPWLYNRTHKRQPFFASAISEISCVYRFSSADGFIKTPLSGCEKIARAWATPPLCRLVTLGLQCKAF